jgi:indole-3-glycerol phosphate synthase
MGFLTDVTEQVRRRLMDHPLDAGALMSRARMMSPVRGLEEALGGASPAIIAEVKRASPSAGAISPKADPVAKAIAFAEGGAAAISVLTERDHFDGSPLDLQATRVAVKIPVLRKDFLIHPDQLIESRAIGADAVLLIVSCLDDSELAGLLAAAADLGLGVLLETHSDADLERALGTDARVIGVNARDRETLEVDLGSALARIARVPHDRIAVAESGISTPAQVRGCVGAGARAVLVGEALMRAADPAAFLRELRGAPPNNVGAVSE